MKKKKKKSHRKSSVAIVRGHCPFSVAEAATGSNTKFAFLPLRNELSDINYVSNISFYFHISSFLCLLYFFLLLLYNICIQKRKGAATIAAATSDRREKKRQIFRKYNYDANIQKYNYVCNGNKSYTYAQQTMKKKKTLFFLSFPFSLIICRIFNITFGWLSDMAMFSLHP